jgi:hypothetical protein
LSSAQRSADATAAPPAPAAAHAARRLAGTDGNTISTHSSVAPGTGRAPTRNRPKCERTMRRALAKLSADKVPVASTRSTCRKRPGLSATLTSLPLRAPRTARSISVNKARCSAGYLPCTNAGRPPSAMAIDTLRA